jgi:hypothetical protein
VAGLIFCTLDHVGESLSKLSLSDSSSEPKNPRNEGNRERGEGRKKRNREDEADGGKPRRRGGGGGKVRDGGREGGKGRKIEWICKILGLGFRDSLVKRDLVLKKQKSHTLPRIPSDTPNVALQIFMSKLEINSLYPHTRRDSVVIWCHYALPYVLPL